MKNFMSLFNQGKKKFPDNASTYWMSYATYKGKFCGRTLREYIRKIIKKEDGLNLKPKEIDDLCKRIIKISKDFSISKK